MARYGQIGADEQRRYKNAVYRTLRRDWPSLTRDEAIQIAFAAGVHRFPPATGSDMKCYYPIEFRFNFSLERGKNSMQLVDQYLVQFNNQGDDPIWIRVTTEDGFQAWSSPAYLFNG